VHLDCEGLGPLSMVTSRGLGTPGRVEGRFREGIAY